MILKAFNAIQIVTLFAGSPLLIGWLWSAEFPGALAALILASVIYAIGFLFITGCVLRTMHGDHDL